MTGFFVCGFGGLFLRGYSLGDILSHGGGSTDGYTGDGGDGDGSG